MYIYIYLYILLVIHYKGFQVYVFEAGLTLKKSHQLFIFSLQHKKLQYLGRCGCWVVYYV